MASLETLLLEAQGGDSEKQLFNRLQFEDVVWRLFNWVYPRLNRAMCDTGSLPSAVVKLTADATQKPVGDAKVFQCICKNPLDFDALKEKLKQMFEDANDFYVCDLFYADALFVINRYQERNKDNAPTYLQFKRWCLRELY